MEKKGARQIELEEEIQNVIDAIGKLANYFDPPLEEFARRMTMVLHPTLQQNFFRCILRSIEKWADKYKNGNYDLRNEDTCRMCQKMFEALGEDIYLKFV